MKLLENSRFEQINSALNMQLETSRIEGRIESYSCKMAGNDKKLFKLISQEGGVGPLDLQALSPPQTVLSHSPSKYSKSFGSVESEGYLCDTIPTKTLFYLISTLNASFNPDYDFSNAKSEEFSREPSIDWVVNTVDTQLDAAAGELFSGLKQTLWAAIDEEINLQDCEIYSYNPDLISDPFGEEGSIWSFNYFMYNKKLKRIVFFTCRAYSVSAPYNSDSGIGQDSELFDYSDTMEFSQEWVPTAGGLSVLISLWNDMFKTIEHRRVVYPQFSLCRGTLEKCLLDFYLSSVCVELVLLMFPGPQTGCFNVNLLFLSVLGQIHKNIHICFYVIFLNSCLFPCLSVALKMCT